MDFSSSTTSKSLRRALIMLGVLAALYGALRIVEWGLMPPNTFPSPYRITINKGQSLFSVSKELSDEGIIRSRRVFEMLVMTFGSDSHISEGEYYFEKPVSVVDVALRIAGKQFGIDRKKVTFPEGFSNKEMAARLDTTFESFDSELFLSLTQGQEGYLFPDTYGFFPSTTPDVIVSTLKNNFKKKIEPLQEEIVASSYTLNEIITMASIIEKEASGDNDRTLVSGILWNRIKANIPLQVDAPFIYLLGKESKELTRKDLALNSPYNTYLYKGLPPTPINNPGLDAITAALHPQASPYFYYLHDKYGSIHYAKTYEEHKRNIRAYLQ